MLSEVRHLLGLSFSDMESSLSSTSASLSSPKTSPIRMLDAEGDQVASMHQKRDIAQNGNVKEMDKTTTEMKTSPIMPILLAGAQIEHINNGTSHSNSDEKPYTTSSTPETPPLRNFQLPSIASSITPSLLEEIGTPLDSTILDLDSFSSCRQILFPSDNHNSLIEKESRTPPRSPKTCRIRRPCPHLPHAMDIDGLPLSPSLESTPASLLMSNMRMEPNMSEAGAEILLCQQIIEPNGIEDTVGTPVESAAINYRPTDTGIHQWPDVPADRQVKISVDSGVDLTADMERDVKMSDGANRKATVPPFYFSLGQNPCGVIRKPDALVQMQFFGVDAENSIGRGLSQKGFEKVTEKCQLPRYLNSCLFRYCGGEKDKPVFFEAFQSCWTTLITTYRSEESLAFAILKKSTSKFVDPDDIECVVHDVVQNHPGLGFLASLPVFQARYVETVVSRIFYSKLHNYNTRMSFAEFKKIDLLNVIKNLEVDEDINSARDVFSYKHFYVIYCKFWELDTDHDMEIDCSALGRYDRSAITPRVISRISEGAGRPVIGAKKDGTMGYRDFIWFILSNEDKRTTQGIEYWFRVLDADGDGVISLYELKYYWDEQHVKMVKTQLSDPWKFDDFVCALIDLVKPTQKLAFTLKDLKKCGTASIFFDMIFDLRKYDNFVRRIDPAWREMDDVVIFDARGKKIKLEGWDKYAERVYDELAIQETQQNYSRYGEINGVYDDDDGAAEWNLNNNGLDSQSNNTDHCTSTPAVSNNGNSNGVNDSSSNSSSWSRVMFSHTTVKDQMDEEEDWVEEDIPYERVPIDDDILCASYQAMKEADEDDTIPWGSNVISSNSD